MGTSQPALEVPVKGTILDFVKLATEKPELAKELAELATRYDFVFADEVSDEELENVAGGVMSSASTELVAQAVEIAKVNGTAQRDQWKSAMALLAETQQRQQQNIQTITNT
jgi:hypothetical protein